MRRVVLYIAVSLDGYIARLDDDISWLDEYTTQGGDYGYAAFMQTIGAALMGARTYTESIKHPERLLSGTKTYVLSRHAVPTAPMGGVEVFNGSLSALLDKIRRETSKDIYVVGGGQLASSLLDLGLLDEMILFIIPKVLGGGLPLFTGIKKEMHLVLTDTLAYPNGIVKLHYRRD